MPLIVLAAPVLISLLIFGGLYLLYLRSLWGILVLAIIFWFLYEQRR